MKNFMDQDFLLESDTSKILFHNYAENLPIIDYHCHISPKDIANDIHFQNITELCLSADHYKWRFMRSCGIEEKYITGDASDYDKFLAWASCLGQAIGNPLFHWSHLELKQYFGYNGILCKNTAPMVWNLCNEKLKQPDMSARGIMLRSNVKLICTTDDPIDSLTYHEHIKDADFGVIVLPAFRPDRILQIEQIDFADYLQQLSIVSGTPIHDLDSLFDALKKRMVYFAAHGCCLADHGLDHIPYQFCTKEQANAILLKRLDGNTLTSLECDQFQTIMMLFFASEYCQKNWTLQLHFGCRRNTNSKMFQRIGANTGFDCMHTTENIKPLASLLDQLDMQNNLPRTILYSLNPNDNEALAVLMGCFQNADAVTKLQLGSAWWFNDTKPEIENQLAAFATLSNLSGFVGMLTDSRSFISYSRHEYFRRILCNYVGNLVEHGEYPNDPELLAPIIQGICYENAKNYFQFPIK